jgi:hypothetical protein
MEIDVPSPRPPSTSGDPPFARSPRLSDLVHSWLATDPLPTSAITVDPEP